MGLKEGLTQTLVVFSVFGAIGFVILSKIRQNNPKVSAWLDKMKFGSMYEKVPENPITDKIEQVYDERRTMM